MGKEAYKSYHTGNWSNTGREAAGIAGGWSGAALGAKSLGIIGATWGAAGGPLGVAIGGALGGLLGGVLGYYSGSWLGKKFFDFINK